MASMTPGERVRAWRKAKDWTQAQLAVKVPPLSVQKLSKYERGELRIPTAMMERLARALGQPMYGENTK